MGRCQLRTGPRCHAGRPREKSAKALLDPYQEVPSQRSLYKNLINIVGDRWTSNLIALTYHGLTRFDQFHRELPVATNILSDRLRFLVEKGVLEQMAYQQRPLRYEYHLTARAGDYFPGF